MYVYALVRKLCVEVHESMFRVALYSNGINRAEWRCIQFQAVGQVV